MVLADEVNDSIDGGRLAGRRDFCCESGEIAMKEKTRTSENTNDRFIILQISASGPLLNLVEKCSAQASPLLHPIPLLLIGQWRRHKRKCFSQYRQTSDERADDQ